MSKKCSRCSNENLKENYKYCPICGLDLKTSKEDILSNLYSVWGNKPVIGKMLSLEAIQFYFDITMEGISTEQYKEYARSREGK